MQLHLLGHVHLTRQGQTVPVSTKAAALLTYLCLEGVAHHREHLAGLLWDTPDPLRNLRVELARLKRDGVVNFPDRQPMLKFQVRLDLTDWLASADQVSDAGLNAWLATLRGLPLSGLEDLGSRTFQQWLESQRWSISEQLERTLELVQARLLHGRHPEAAGHIQARADRLGLNLPVPVSAQPPLPGSALAAPAPTSPAPVPSAWPAGTDLPARSAPEPEWRCLWDEHLQLTRLMHQARTQPQLVLLSGRPGSGKRSLIRQSVEGSGWQAIYLQASVGRPLFLEALSQHLNALVQQPVPQRVSGVRPARPGSDDSLIELASTLHRSELSLVIAVQNAALGQVWLPELVRFLLDLPLSLILVLSESGQVRMEALRQDLAFLEPQRVHQFQMPPLSPRMLLQAWQLQAEQREQRQNEPTLAAPSTGTLPPTTPLQRLEGDEALTRATRLIQRSEGWPLHAQALYRQPGQDDLPDIVRATLLSEVAQLNPELRQALASLSVVNAPIGPEIVTLLLGEAAPELLLQAVRQRLLTPAASREDIALPSLYHRSDDQTRALQFGSEALRVALAGSLTGLERQELRQRLAHHFLPLHPALSLYYARKAGLNELAAAALQAARQRSPQCKSASGLGQVADPLAAPPRPARAVGAPAALPPFRREVRTSNGYRVALDSGTLEVLRYGWYGPPPLLVLNAAAGAAGPWQMTARIDVFRDTPELGCCPRGYALGIKCGPGPELNYAPEGQVPEDRVPEGQDRLQDGPECSSGAPSSSSSSSSSFGVVPLGRWFTLQGEAQAGPLQLSVRALDVALTVADFSCGGRELLPVRS